MLALLWLFIIIVGARVGACAVAVATLLTPEAAPGWLVLPVNVVSFVVGFRAGVRLISAGPHRVRHSAPKSEGPILPG
jgi:hypothetical protein